MSQGCADLMERCLTNRSWQVHRKPLLEHLGTNQSSACSEYTPHVTQLPRRDTAHGMSLPCQGAQSTCHECPAGLAQARDLASPTPDRHATATNHPPNSAKKSQQFGRTIRRAYFSAKCFPVTRIMALAPQTHCPCGCCVVRDMWKPL